MNGSVWVICAYLGQWEGLSSSRLRTVLRVGKFVSSLPYRHIRESPAGAKSGTNALDQVSFLNRVATLSRNGYPRRSLFHTSHIPR